MIKLICRLILYVFNRSSVVAYIFTFGLLLLPFLGLGQSFSLQGQVVDERGQPVGGAPVHLLTPEQWQSTTHEGFFTFTVPADTVYTLAIHSLGYAEQHVQLSPSGGQPLVIRLQPETKTLTEVTVGASAIRSTATSSQAVATVTRADLDQATGGSFVDALTPVAGINAINTGVGIAKPVIRGMSYNRIMVNDQGVKQEGQQWGSDHGLEIDQFDVQQVEIIKGPASLRYGSDAMGGSDQHFARPLSGSGATPNRGQGGLSV